MTNCKLEKKFSIPKYAALSAEQSGEQAQRLRELMTEILATSPHEKGFDSSLVRVVNAGQYAWKENYSEAEWVKLPHYFKIQYGDFPGNIGDLIFSQNGQGVTASIVFLGYWPPQLHQGSNLELEVFNALKEKLRWEPVEQR